MTSWIGVASGEHVRRGIDLGIAQIGHGKRAGLARMQAGDTIFYYSPVEKQGDQQTLRAFTAIGTIIDDEIWQADEGDFRPFRRRVRYENAIAIPIDELKTKLKLTSSSNWGYQLRGGLVQIDEEDSATIRNAMCTKLIPVPNVLESEFDNAKESPGFMLWIVTNAWQKAVRAALRPYDLTHVQFVLLASLTWLSSDTPVTQRALATHAHTDVMMTSQVLRALEEKGLIRRSAHPTDSRAIELNVTAAGTALANSANAVVEKADHTFFSKLKGDDKTLTSLLRRLAPND